MRLEYQIICDNLRTKSFRKNVKYILYNISIFTFCNSLYFALEFRQLYGQIEGEGILQSLLQRKEREGEDRAGRGRGGGKVDLRRGNWRVGKFSGVREFEGAARVAGKVRFYFYPLLLSSTSLLHSQFV